VLAGDICRCTGCAGIVAALLEVSEGKGRDDQRADHSHD
jgi:aerobic-type carbon monoxide dehydrogenase small subunit (CoxS/CutS family)